ncbi:MAG TPA: ABC transporter permease [Chthonomonadaceae bacterium]|nr:ABC transporter permease [Chthonomonadaceae bacterium]
MLTFILKRLALAIPTLLAISLVVFIAARLAPSDPIELMAGEKASPETVARLRRQYGLDKPLLVQYGNYVWGIVAHGDFGRSFARGGQPVSQMIAQDFPVTAQLAVTAMLFAVLLGLPVGVLAALYHNAWFDRAAMAVVVALVSVPSIVLGPLLVLAFSIRLGWLPVSGWESPIYLILPTVTLGARSAALIARFMRSSLLDVLRQDYLRTAIAKGLSRWRAVWRHALKNAFLPVLTILGTNFGILLTGSFVVETLFQIPGIGYESINSISKRDYPVIQGMALLVAILFLVVNLIVDILYGLVDPRVSAQEGQA